MTPVARCLLSSLGHKRVSWPLLIAMLGMATACASPVEEESGAAVGSELARATPIRHAVRLSCRASWTGGAEPFELEVFDDGARTTHATMLGPSWRDQEPVVLAPVDDRTIGELPHSYRGPGNVVFRAGSAGNYFVLPKAIGRLTILSDERDLDGHITVVDESGSPRPMSCVALQPHVTPSDVPPAIEGMMARGEHHGLDPEGRPCTVVVGDAQPLEVTPDDDENTRERLATQDVRFLVRIKGAAPDGRASSTTFVPTNDVSMFQSARPAVLHVDSHYYTWMAPAEIGHRSLVVERAQGASRGYHVTIGAPLSPETPLAICDTN